MTVEDIRMLENNGYNDDIIIGGKGSLSTFNVTVRSIDEKQPSKIRPTVYVYGRDGYIDMSQIYGQEHFSDRVFTIVFNLYEKCGDRKEQRDRLVNWLRSGEGQSIEIHRNHTKTTYTNARIDIGDFKEDTPPKDKYQSTLTVTITTSPRITGGGAII